MTHRPVASLKFVTRTLTSLGLAALVSLAAVSTVSAAPRAKATAAPAASSESTEASDLKAASLKIRNTDPHAVRVDEWRSLIERLNRAVKSAPQGPEAGALLFNTAALYETLYREHRDDDDLDQAVALFGRTARDYSSNPLADDALIRQGDLLLYDAHAPKRAKESFQLLLQRFPKSELRPAAEARLREIAGEKPHDAARAASDLPSPRYTLKGARPIVMLDPGHGGEDFGASGVGGLLEKDVTLDVAMRLEKILAQELGMIVRLTRRKDQFIPLAERTAMANDFDANLFVSLHSNASPGGKLSGIETYYLDNTDNHAAKTLAERENSSLRFEGEGTEADLQYMLSDLIQTGKLEDSIALAKNVQGSLNGAASKQWGKVHSFGVKKAPFYVLVGAHMPCTLVEMFFIDNPIDGAHLADKGFRDMLAHGIADGIGRYFATVADKPGSSSKAR